MVTKLAMGHDGRWADKLDSNGSYIAIKPNYKVGRLCVRTRYPLCTPVTTCIRSLLYYRLIPFIRTDPQPSFSLFVISFENRLSNLLGASYIYIKNRDRIGYKRG